MTPDELDEVIQPLIQSAFRAGIMHGLDDLLSELQADEAAGVPISVQRVVAAGHAVQQRGLTAVLNLPLDGTT